MTDLAKYVEDFVRRGIAAQLAVQDVKRPYSYLYQGRFTEVKHREVACELQTDADASYELEAIKLDGLQPFAVRFTPPQLSESGVVIVESLTLHPCVRFPAGTKIVFTAALRSDIHVGRKRPRFQVWLHGCKSYGTLKTPSS